MAAADKTVSGHAAAANDAEFPGVSAEGVVVLPGASEGVAVLPGAGASVGVAAGEGAEAGEVAAAPTVMATF